MIFSLRAKERQQQKQQMTVQDLILPIIPTRPPSPMPETNNNELLHSINIKDEKIEAPVLKAKQDLSMAKPIDRRRNEVNERSDSSTTAIDFVLDYGARSETPTDILPMIDDEEDVVESKSFIHNLDFNLNTSIGTDE